MDLIISIFYFAFFALILFAVPIGHLITLFQENKVKEKYEDPEEYESLASVQVVIMVALLIVFFVFWWNLKDAGSGSLNGIMLLPFLVVYVAAVVYVQKLIGRLELVKAGSVVHSSAFLDQFEKTKEQFLACFTHGNVRQRLGQLALQLKSVDDAVLVGALVWVILNETDHEKQQLAGGLLWVLQPEYKRDLSADLYASLTHWDLSVEEWPWYLYRAVGMEAMSEGLQQVAQKPLSDDQQKAVQTMHYWLNGTTIEDSLDQRWGEYFAAAAQSEAVSFIHLNPEWNADPNVPDEHISVAGNEVTLRFKLNHHVYENTNVGDVGGITFSNCQRYRLGPVNDEGFYQGQCRFSELCPQWGEFYRVQGDANLLNQPKDWKKLGGTGDKHYVFYLKDATFECVAEDFVFSQGDEG